MISLEISLRESQQDDHFRPMLSPPASGCIWFGKTGNQTQRTCFSVETWLLLVEANSSCITVESRLHPKSKMKGLPQPRTARLSGTGSMATPMLYPVPTQ